jgi:hypothetical protein
MTEENRRPWLRAGVLFGGGLTWCSAVFGAMVEHALWTGASAGFGWALTVSVAWALAVRAGYASAADGVRALFRRAAATLMVGAVLWGAYVFVTLVMCGRSADGAMLVLGFLGILTVFVVLGVLGRTDRQRRGDRAVRLVRALAWLTVGLVSTTALVPPLADWMARRGRSPYDRTPIGETPDAVDD